MKHQSDAVTTNRSVRARAIGHPHRTNRTRNMGIGAFLKGAVKGVKGAVKKILPKKDDSNGSAADAKAPLMNSAFVFIKPHANTRAVQDLVVAKLTSKRVKILAEGDIAAAKIDKDKLIDQHYYAIASKATLLKPEQLPVPEAKFEAKFGISWKQALADGLVYNATDACAKLGVDADGLDGLVLASNSSSSRTSLTRARPVARSGPHAFAAFHRRASRFAFSPRARETRDEDAVYDERASARGGGSTANVGWIFHGGERGTAREGGRVDDARGVVIGGCVLVGPRGGGSCMGDMGNWMMEYEDGLRMGVLPGDCLGPVVNSFRLALTLNTPAHCSKKIRVAKCSQRFSVKSARIPMN